LLLTAAAKQKTSSKHDWKVALEEEINDWPFSYRTGSTYFLHEEYALSGAVHDGHTFKEWYALEGRHRDLCGGPPGCACKDAARSAYTLWLAGKTNVYLHKEHDNDFYFGAGISGWDIMPPNWPEIARVGTAVENGAMTGKVNGSGYKYKEWRRHCRAGGAFMSATHNHINWCSCALCTTWRYSYWSTGFTPQRH